MSLAARLLAALALPLLAQAPVLHGADSVFAGPDVGIVWGVLRGEAEDKTLVVIRVTNPSRRYAWIKVEGVDPFTQRRLEVVAGMALAGHADVRSLRATFADWPRREIHLYATEGDWRTGRPALTVYYLGVPDTTPEFTTEAALEQYLGSPPSPRR